MIDLGLFFTWELGRSGFCCDLALAIGSFVFRNLALPFLPPKYLVMWTHSIECLVNKSLMLCRPILTSIQLEMQKVVELVHIELLMLVEILWCSLLVGGISSRRVNFYFWWNLLLGDSALIAVELNLISSYPTCVVSGCHFGGKFRSQQFHLIVCSIQIWKWNLDSVSVNLYGCVFPVFFFLRCRKKFNSFRFFSNFLVQHN